MEAVYNFWREILVVALLVANMFCWYVFRCELPVPYFTIAVLNVGQGESIYIESPTHTRLIINGGPPHALLSELQKVMPFYVRKINIIIASDFGTNYISGLIDVLNSYTVDAVIESGAHPTTALYKTLSTLIYEKNISDVSGRKGMVIHLGSSTDLTILYPDRDTSTASFATASMILKLTYGSTSVMLAGAATGPVENYVVERDGTTTLLSTLLKVSDGGSKQSASELFVKAVNPSFALISGNLNPKVSLPDPLVLKILNQNKIPTLVTTQEGTIIFHCTTTRCQRVK